MALHPKSLQVIEDVETASYLIRCTEGHEFPKPGRWLLSHLLFGCPVCGCIVSHTQKQVTDLFTERLKMLYALAAEGKFPPDKSDE